MVLIIPTTKAQFIRGYKPSQLGGKISCPLQHTNFCLAPGFTEFVNTANACCVLFVKKKKRFTI